VRRCCVVLSCLPMACRKLDELRTFIEEATMARMVPPPKILLEYSRQSAGPAGIAMRENAHTSFQRACNRSPGQTRVWRICTSLLAAGNMHGSPRYRSGALGLGWRHHWAVGIIQFNDRGLLHRLVPISPKRTCTPKSPIGIRSDEARCRSVTLLRDVTFWSGNHRSVDSQE